MELLRFSIRPDGTLGPRFRNREPAPAPKKAGPLPGAALAAFAEEDDDDWGGDAPDVSADFARLANPQAEAERPQLPLTADFAPNPDGTLTLMRWPRLARPALIPDSIDGRAVTRIAATAFAALHLEEGCFSEFYHSPISYSVFCMRMGRRSTAEERDEGGPTSVRLPARLASIGPYAFWHCDRLTEIALPGGVTELPPGVFGECSRLASVLLPEGLQKIGFLPRPTDQVMPDVGVFAGCHALKTITLPASLTVLGAHTFNSAGLARLTVRDTGPAARWGRTVQVAATAFDHSAALLWLDKAAPDGRVLYRVALPAARDKILAGDRRFGPILRVPVDFFCCPPQRFDELAQQAFRLDFSGRMALARLEYGGALSAAAREWYRELLVHYFDRAPQFMPGLGPGSIPAAPEQPYEVLYAFLEAQPDLTAAELSELLRTAGTLRLSAALLARMMEVRTQRFSTVTGFEELEL